MGGNIKNSHKHFRRWSCWWYCSDPYQTRWWRLWVLEKSTQMISNQFLFIVDSLVKILEIKFKYKIFVIIIMLCWNKISSLPKLYFLQNKSSTKPSSSYFPPCVLLMTKSFLKVLVNQLKDHLCRGHCQQVFIVILVLILILAWIQHLPFHQKQWL